MEVLEGQEDLEHPAGDHRFRHFFLLALEVVLKIALLAVLLDDVGPGFFPDDVVEGDNVGMGEGAQEADLGERGTTSCIVLLSSTRTFLAM
jgi:hypothetical protein